MIRLALPALGLAMSLACGGGTGPAPKEAPAETTPAKASPAPHHDKAQAGHDHDAKPEASGEFTALESGRIFFIEPTADANVSSPFKVVFGVDGVNVAPAGEPKPNSGHHHIIVDGTHIEQGKPVPKDDTHIHFGKGQTETTLELAPGKHTLTMQLADWAHRSYGKKFSSTITIEVATP